MSFCVCVVFTVREPNLAAFATRVADQARASLTEPGCRVFDVWTDPARTDTVFLYEVYDDRAAFEAHLATEHFLAFDAETSEWMVGKHVDIFSSRIAA